MEKRQHNPLDTRRRFDVYETSVQRRRLRRDILLTFKRRCVSTRNPIESVKETHFFKLPVILYYCSRTEAYLGLPYG